MKADGKKADEATGSCSTGECDELVDLDTSLSHFGDDEALLVRILRIFIDDLPATLSMLEKAIAEKNIDETRLHTHTLISNAGMIGSKTLSELSTRMNRLAKQGLLNDVAVLFGSFNELSKQAVARLVLWVDEHALHESE